MYIQKLNMTWWFKTSSLQPSAHYSSLPSYTIPLTRGHHSYQDRFQMHWDFKILKLVPVNCALQVKPQLSQGHDFIAEGGDIIRGGLLSVLTNYKRSFFLPPSYSHFAGEKKIFHYNQVCYKWVLLYSEMVTNV